MKTLRWFVLTAILGVIASVVVSGATAAESPTQVTVKGTQTIVDEPKGKYEMHGDLVGKFNNTGFKLNYSGADGQFVGSGKEVFIGCHDTDRSGTCDADEPSGTMRFTFIFWANYNPKTQKLIKGQCVHPVGGGTGDFAKAKGVLHMKDTPTKGGVRTTYTGTLEYAGATASSRWVSAASRSLQSRSTRGACGG